jgi:hypothetical protein
MQVYKALGINLVNCGIWENSVGCRSDCCADGELIRELGMTMMAPIWMIAIDRYICPPLNMILGMHNTILSGFIFIGWIDKCDGLERLSESLLSTRTNFTEAVSNLQDFQEEQMVWVQLVGPQLA